ncbi:pyridoxamine 5'-phosphate oxidase family protein [Mucilaginibacter robiniae]|uniref:Pyridoxamine 5'-phosphate oxidase family protein n=1 Tax=Mucilaginibacter robiniae TaxID=2728022 RepID=A0A7L5DWX3_9SPHI|nr:pyridoxamine 5'-phosphate oxidase family protein [Mucilaginibacter robiniae]QJD94587.1 pyridoxamine 5'-phosphate oxidase family protein [Mucilaginibacter robiniae]
MKTPAAHLIPSRAPKRAHFDAETIYPILDEALLCTISCVIDNRPFSIPTAFVRYEDKIYLHGSVGSHFIREIEKGIPVCIVVTLTDALVVAKSAFSYSMNYRSVIIFAQAEKIELPAEKVKALEWLTNKVVPNSWNYLRLVTESEMRKTTVLAFNLEEASAKVRTGMPNDEPEDKQLRIWSGIIPLQTQRMAPVADQFSQHIPLPKHLNL